MIKECNFKSKDCFCSNAKTPISHHKNIAYECPGEENCILFQTYNNTFLIRNDILAIEKKINYIQDNQQELRKMILKPRKKTQEPKKKEKPIQYNRVGNMRHLPTAMKKLLKEVARNETNTQKR